MFSLISFSFCHSTVSILGQYGREVRELSQLAWEGVESNKTLFHEKDFSPDVLQAVDRTGILSKVRRTFTICCFSFNACRAAWKYNWKVE